MILVALFLVNLPFAHETLTDRKIAASGRDVEATVVKTGTINGRRLVDYRLPRAPSTRSGPCTPVGWTTRPSSWPARAG